MANVIPAIISEHQRLNKLANEAILDISLMAVPEPNGDQQIIACLDYIKINGNPLAFQQLLMDKIKLRPGSTKIKYDLFYDLFDEARRLTSETSGYVTGLRMHYGVNEDGDLCLLYEPVVMIRGTHQSGVEFEYDVFESKNYYVFNPDQEKFESAVDVTVLASYITKVTLIHTAAGTMYTGITEDDAKSALFTFQEIFSVLQQNPTVSIAVYSAIYEDDDQNIWHSLLLAPDGVQPIDNLKGVYANLAHLCPPNCPKVKYSLHQKRKV